MEEYFFGYLPPFGSNVDPETCRMMTTAMGLDFTTCSKDRFLLCSKHPDNSFNDGHYQAIIVGRPRWADPELEAIAREQSNAAALVHGWKKFSRGIFLYLRNHFSFVLIDVTNDNALLAVDRLGVSSLYFTIADNSFIFGNNLEPILSHPLVNRCLDHQGIFNYLYFHMIPSPGTAYKAIKKLKPAQELSWTDGSLSTKTYWSPTFSDHSSRNIDAAGAELMAVLGDSVKDASAVQQPIGSFLSGGIDSSTVSGLLAQQSDEPVNTYSIGFEAEGYDEIPYARIASKHFGSCSHEYYVKPEDIVATVHTIASAYEEPFGNSSALPAYYCAREAASDGIQLLLAGDGGDELFAGNQRYAKQFIFEKYYGIPKAIRHGILEPMARRFSDSTITLLRKPASYIEQACIPLPDRFETYNFLHRFGDLSFMFSSEFLSKVDTEDPLKLMRDRYNEPEDASILNRMLYLDWKFTLADNDIRKVTGMCHLAGIDVAYPMLDDQVVDFSCAIPSTWKLSRGKLRYFFKQSVKDFLPKSIITKKKHGFGLPFGIWTSSNLELQSLAYKSVRSLEQRNIFNTNFLESAIKLHSEGHSTYYGTLIWVLMMLELWLEAHNL